MEAVYRSWENPTEYEKIVKMLVVAPGIKLHQRHWNGNKNAFEMATGTRQQLVKEVLRPYFTESGVSSSTGRARSRDRTERGSGGHFC